MRLGIPANLFIKDRHGVKVNVVKARAKTQIRHSFVKIQDGKCIGFATSMASVAEQSGVTKSAAQTAIINGLSRIGDFLWVQVEKIKECKNCESIMKLEDRYIIKKGPGIATQYSNICKTCSRDKAREMKAKRKQNDS